MSLEEYEMKNVKEIIDDAVKKSRKLKEGLIQGNWSSIIGEDLSKKSYVSALKDQVLFIHVENSVWLQQFSFMKQDIIRKVNAYLNLEYVKDVQLRISKMKIEEYFKEVEDEVKFEPDKIVLDANIEKESEEIIHDINDNVIKEKIKKLLILSKKKEKFLLDRGSQKCIDCGIIFKGSQVRCTVCENKLRKQKLELIYSIIKSNLNIPFEGVKPVLKDFRESEFKDMKQEIKEKYKRLMHKAINDEEMELFEEYAKKYFTLEIEKDDIDEINRLIRSYLENLE